jgi:hypothetical protein
VKRYKAELLVTLLRQIETEIANGKTTPQGFDVLVIDAFSGDAIPVHLLTQEAFEIYFRQLRRPSGILAIHISNAYLDLRSGSSKRQNILDSKQIAQFAGGGDTQSSGFIAAYDLATGKFDGLLQDAGGKPLAINGIWSLSPGNVSPTNNDPAAAPAAEVYFTAGPNHGSGGLFGYLTAVSAELTEGNAQ